MDRSANTSLCTELCQLGGGGCAACGGAPPQLVSEGGSNTKIGNTCAMQVFMSHMLLGHPRLTLGARRSGGNSEQVVRYQLDSHEHPDRPTEPRRPPCGTLRGPAAVCRGALVGASSGTYTLTGPRAVTHVQIARALSSAIGRNIIFQDLSVDPVHRGADRPAPGVAARRSRRGLRPFRPRRSRRRAHVRRRHLRAPGPRHHRSRPRLRRRVRFSGVRLAERQTR